MVLHLAFAQLRFRPGRSIALVVVLVATVACFALVSASAKAQQVNVQGTLRSDSRAAYDLLVRPAGSATEAERRGDLVSSTAMSSLDGGITLKQWHEIEQIPGVYAAAPVAVVGYDYLQYDAQVHVPSPGPGESQVLYRLNPTFVSENGLTKVPADDQYVYITTKPLDFLQNGGTPGIVQPGGKVQPICQTTTGTSGNSEIVPACGSTSPHDSWNPPSSANPHATGVPGAGVQDLPTGTQDIAWYFPFLVEAIDPVQEARLDGLDKAVTSGSYFAESTAPVSYSAAKPDAQTRKIAGCTGVFATSAEPSDEPSVCQWTSVPVLAAATSPMDEALRVSVDRLTQADAAMVGDSVSAVTLAQVLPGATPAATTTITTVTAQQVYAQLLAQLAGKNQDNSAEASDSGNAADAGDFETLMTAAPVHYADHGTAQVAQQVSAARLLTGIQALTGLTIGLDDVYPDLTDTAVRMIYEHDRTQVMQAPDPPADINGWLNAPQLNLVGTFNPAKVSDGSSALSAVPMPTYFPDTATGANAASVAALGGEPLRPNGDMAGLLSVSPSLLTTISSLPELENPDRFQDADLAHGVNTAAPISVIRVKLTGTVGLDAASQARLRLVAQEIYQRTGLLVDITQGSSPAPVTVIDPAGLYGRPQLELSEMWSRMGAAELISSSIDAKTRLLNTLVLLLGTVFVASAVAASVRRRRRELAILACAGWPRRWLFGLIAAECAFLGCAAGLGGAALVAVLAPVTGARFGLGTYVALALAAPLLTCVAGAYPALMAASAHPGAATAQLPAPIRRGQARARHVRDRARARSVIRLAVVNVLRVPGRSLLAVIGVALAVSGLTLLAALTLAFHGSTSGTLLGQAIIVQVHAADYVAAGACAVLGLALAGDIYYTATRDRAAEHALLQAIGWTPGDLTRLSAAETAITAVAGALAGTSLPVLGIWVVTGALPAGAVAAAAGIAAGGVVCTMCASLGPSRRVLRTAPARHLAEG
jgi:putative ABC transport system permease protein